MARQPRAWRSTDSLTRLCRTRFTSGAVNAVLNPQPGQAVDVARRLVTVSDPVNFDVVQLAPPRRGSNFSPISPTRSASASGHAAARGEGHRRPAQPRTADSFTQVTHSTDRRRRLCGRCRLPTPLGGTPCPAPDGSPCRGPSLSLEPPPTPSATGAS
jgi:hypothetical protein